MLAPIILAALAGASAPAIAGAETAIPRISEFLEWRADGKRGLYIRADTGLWYYARTDAPCARLPTALSLHFAGTVQNQLDRNSQIIAEGWRCTVASVTLSQEPPSAGRRVPRQLQTDLGQNQFKADLTPATFGRR